MSDYQQQPHTSGHPGGWTPPAAPHLHPSAHSHSLQHAVPVPQVSPGMAMQQVPGHMHPQAPAHAQPQVVVVEQPRAAFVPQPATAGPNPFVPAVARRDGAFGLAIGMLLIALVFAAALAMQAHLPGYQPEAAPAAASAGSDFTPVTPVERAGR